MSNFKLENHKLEDAKYESPFMEKKIICTQMKHINYQRISDIK